MTEWGSSQASDALIARIESLLRDNHALARSLESERDERSRLLAAVARIEGENAALRETLETARAMNDAVSALPGAIADQGGKIEGLADRISHLVIGLLRDAPPVAIRSGGEANEAAEQLHAILTSRSWRITRPMRGLGRMINRIRN